MQRSPIDVAADALAQHRITKLGFVSTQVTVEAATAVVEALQAHGLLQGGSPPSDDGYGCHLEVSVGELPDACVKDMGADHLCIYAKKYKCKTECPYWQPITKS
jgi:hypothetical protein